MRAAGAGGQHVNKTESATVDSPGHWRGSEMPERAQPANQKPGNGPQDDSGPTRAARRGKTRRRKTPSKYKNRAKVGLRFADSQPTSCIPPSASKDSRTGYLEHNFQDVLIRQLAGFLDSYLKWRMKGELAGTLGDEE